jgi:hypothetical protein
MGFMDKAKKMAEQAQGKLDEVQKQFNEGQKPAAGEQPVQEYDQHGRPVGPGVGGAESSSTPPHGDPVAQPSPPAAPPSPPPAAPTPDPAAPTKEEDPYAPPKLSGGDPLAG